jgi:hypothetical protein
VVSGAGWPTKDRNRPRKIVAEFESYCPECSDEISIGQTIYWSEYHEQYVCSVTCR